MPTRRTASKNVLLLQSSQLEEFRQNGYLLLKGILNAAECQKFDFEIVQPALRKYGGIDQTDPTTWNTEILRGMATGDYRRESPDILPGVMVRTNSGSNPIPDDHSLDLSVLNPLLDQLHGNSNAWKWHHSNVGWIHVRFPLDLEDRTKTEAGRIWHVDGGHFTPHYIDSPEQSVIILPMIRSVNKGGGNTRILRKSHIYIAKKLGQAKADGIPREFTQNANDIASIWPKNLITEVSPCDAGDVLLMHPFVVHSAGQASKGQPLRIAFNMGVRWTIKPRIIHVNEDENKEKSTSWLERSIIWALNAPLDFLTA